MADASGELRNSLKQYKESKNACLAFIKKAETAAREYANFFPAPVKDASENLPDKFANIARKIESAKLKILVAGQFKMGKSTLINALLGEEVLPAYSTPCTAVITQIEYGENKKAILSFKTELSETPQNVSEKIKRHIGDRKKDIPDLIIESENLGDELEDFLVIPEEDMVKEQKTAVAESPYSLCRLFWPLEICRNDVEIIDSPGLNEASARDETTYKYVPQADMILHVLNANQLYGKYDKNFVENLLAKGNSPLIFVVNRFDQLNSEKDKERVINYARRVLSNSTPYAEEGIYFISAFKALQGKLNKEAGLYEESGFADFERMLAKIISRDRGRIKLAANLRAALLIIANLSGSYIPELRNKLDDDVEELEKKFASQKKEFERLDYRVEAIKKIIEGSFRNIQRAIRQQISGFFKSFASESLDAYVNETEFDLSLWNQQESQKKAVEEMTQEMLSGLRREFDLFNHKQSAQIAEMMEDLKSVLKDQLQEFNDSLNAIRLDLDMQVNDQNVAISRKELGDLDFSENFIEAGVKAGLLGGGMGIGAVFLASRFLAILGGPVGWGFTILSTLGAALYAVLNDTSAVEKLKAEYIQASRKKILEQSDEWAAQLSADIADDLERQKKEFVQFLNARIDETRNPILEAIQMMRSNQINLDDKKRQLEQFRERFMSLEKEGEMLAEKL